MLSARFAARLMIVLTLISVPLTRANQATDAEVLTAFHATYTATRHGVERGESSLKLTKSSSDTYLLENKSNASFLMLDFERAEETAFKINSTGQVIPSNYKLRQSAPFSKKSVDQTFDWANNLLTGTKESRAFEFTLFPGAQDKLSYQAQLIIDLKNGHQTLSYPVIYRGRQKSYDYKVIGEEILTTPLGDLICIKIQRGTMESKRATILWLAKTRHYIPIQFHYFQEGELQGEVKLKALEIL